MKKKAVLLIITFIMLVMCPLTVMASPISAGPVNPWEQQEDGSRRFKVGDKYIAGELVTWKNRIFYIDPDGRMAKGWRNVNNQYYYFAESDSIAFPEGAMYVNTTTPDNRQVDETGALIGAFDPNQRPNPYGNQTCIEVDLTNQCVYVYVGYNLVASAPCVTGRMTAARQTTPGDFTIYSKETNRYLQGLNEDGSKYKSYVNYWMPFNGGQGLHDATWRGSFGGQIYVRNGSHGCVNLPLDFAAQMFNVAYVGMPVHVHS